MGGKPIFALNIVGFPSQRLPLTVLEEILSGAYDKAGEAGISIIGGHTVDDSEPKFGLAVNGLVSPQKIVRNNTARVGDILILTKPLGTGILSTALKRGLLKTETVHLLHETMARLNKAASEAMEQIGVNACTDITGFGLIGHLLEMVSASKVSAVLFHEEIPFLPEVHSLAVSDVVPGGSLDNFHFTREAVDYSDSISEVRKVMLNDAQTSGGLLISVPAENSQKLIKRLMDKEVETIAKIGEIIEQEYFKIKIR
jgi:selenium donor protein